MREEDGFRITEARLVLVLVLVLDLVLVQVPVPVQVQVPVPVQVLVSVLGTASGYRGWDGGQSRGSSPRLGRTQSR